jgi:hypothetical protein
LLATVVDLEYGKGPLPDESYFERITLELGDLAPPGIENPS